MRVYLVKRNKPAGYYSTGAIFRRSLAPSRRKPPRGMSPASVIKFPTREKAAGFIEALGFIYPDARKMFCVVKAESRRGRALRLVD